GESGLSPSAYLSAPQRPSPGPATATGQGVYSFATLTPLPPIVQNGRESGTDPPAQRVVRAAQGSPLAEGGHALVPGQGRSHLSVRPGDPRCFIQLQAAVGHPAASLPQDQAPVRLRAVLAAEYLRTARPHVPILRLS